MYFHIQVCYLKYVIHMLKLGGLLQIITISQNTTKLLYYVLQYVLQLHVSALFLRPSSGCIH
jgi:hypothetical protein